MNHPSATALIAEDEAPQRNELIDLLAEVWPNLAVVASCGDGTQALSAITDLRPDVAFLDINLPEASGIEVARAATRHTQVVFITAHDHFAIQAFESGAIDYLLKPVRRYRLETTISRIVARLEKHERTDLAGTLATLQELLAGRPKQFLKWITTGAGATTNLIAIDDVLFFQAQDKYTRVVTADGAFHIRLSLKELLSQLDPENFWQIHRSTIVRVAAVRFVRRSDEGRHLLSVAGNSEILSVSSAFAHRFKGM